MNKTKTCPFCGIAPKVKVDGTKRWWTVYCDSLKCLIAPEADDYLTEGRAIAAWNHRTK